jgi:hypothetical protein
LGALYPTEVNADLGRPCAERTSNYHLLSGAGKGKLGPLSVRIPIVESLKRFLTLPILIPCRPLSNHFLIAHLDHPHMTLVLAHFELSASRNILIYYPLLQLIETFKYLVSFPRVVVVILLL